MRVPREIFEDLMAPLTEGASEGGAQRMPRARARCVHAEYQLGEGLVPPAHGTGRERHLAAV